jgi:excisionase family DNA binding protein
MEVAIIPQSKMHRRNGMQDKSNEKLFYTERELAEKLQVTVRTIYNMRRDGQIPHMKLRGTVRYPVDQIKQWIAESSWNGNS